MTDKNLTLTLDVGTSSTRVLLWDAGGHEVAGVRAQVQYHMSTTPDGGVEMAPDELLGHVGDCLDQALTQIGDRAGAIAAVGMSTFWHSLIGMDANLQPITPLYNWSDQRSGDVARRLRHDLDGHAVHQRTGCILHPSYYPAKIVWLRETQRELYDRVMRWASPSEYLFSRWFGERAKGVSVSIASGTGLLSQQRCEWDGETLTSLNIPVEKFAVIVPLRERAQGLQPEWAARWPALKDVPFFPAIGDGACGNVGSGCLTPERFAINLGTSGAIRALFTEPEEQPGVHTPQLVVPTGLWRYRADEHRPLFGAAFSDGGVVYAWMSKTLQLPPAEELEQQLSTMEPGVHGLMFLPFLAGERSLGWNPDARAALTGMNLDTSPVEMVRAAMEAIALRFALAAQRLQDLFPQVTEIVASGGVFAKSPTWAQIFADAIGQPMTLAAEPEASSRGAALLAMEALGLLASAADSPARLGQTFAPNADRHARYQELLVAQQKLYAQLIEQK